VLNARIERAIEQLNKERAKRGAPPITRAKLDVICEKWFADVD